MSKNATAKSEKIAKEEIVKQTIREMNAAWLNSRIDDLYDYFAEDVVFVPPGDQARLVGQAAAVESFRQYTEQVITHAFEETDLLVDIMGATAVARLRFNVRYEYEGTTHDEEGEDLFVLNEADGGWEIVWRMQMTG